VDDGFSVRLRRAAWPAGVLLVVLSLAFPLDTGGSSLPGSPWDTWMPGLARADESSKPGRTGSRNRHIGFATAFYHNRFVDDVVSPVVYVGSSPRYELFYRSVNDTRLAAMSFAWTQRSHELLDSGGQEDRHLHRLDSYLLEAGYEYLRRVSRLEPGRTKVYVGGRVSVYGEDFRNTTDDVRETWLASISMALGAAAERKIRDRHMLAAHTYFALISRASRPKYSHEHIEGYNSSFMSLAGFTQLSILLSYEHRLSSKIGLRACLCLQHLRVDEPRRLRSVSQSLSLGATYAF
jgi:hypothetical protein